MWRILDIGGNELFIHVDHENLIAVKDRKEINRAHFSDIHSIICHSYGATYSDKLLKKCLEYKIPFVICDDAHIPQGMLLPFIQHTNSADRLKIQLNTTIPRRKHGWQLIISEKLTNQARLIEKQGDTETGLKIRLLAKHVLSGDPDNKEAQGARMYFTAIFGKKFRRDSQEESNINSLLNYGYTILRSCIARAIIGAGLHPSFGVHHSSKSNPYALVDDLIEPFRPIVDFIVLNIIKDAENTPISLDSNNKKKMISISKFPVYFLDEHLEFTDAAQHFAHNYLNYLDGEELNFPTFNYDIPI